mgnify:CR=1 FL=1
MIVILDSLINVLTLQIGFILGNMIHLLLTPAGVVMAVSLLIYLEYLTIKSITKDMQWVLLYLNSHKFKNTFIATFQSTVLPIILKKKNILVSRLISKRHIIYNVNITDTYAFAFAPSHKYKEKIEKFGENLEIPITTTKKTTTINKLLRSLDVRGFLLFWR